MGQTKLFKVTSEEELAFLNYLKKERGFSDHTVSSYKEDVSRYLGFLATAGLEYRNVTQEQIRGYLLDLNNAQLDKRTIRRMLSALKHFYRFLFLKDYIKYDPFEFISSPKVERKLPDFLTDEEVKQLFNANAQRKDMYVSRDQAILELLFASGLRASELVNLTLQAVNMRDRILRIFGKGKKERMVPFSMSAKAALEN